MVVFNKDQKKYPKVEELAPGWCGAMCQGQAISVLVRAFLTSGNQEYLAAAERAVGVFNLTSVEGGVRAVFMEKHVWYEEYPTNPHLSSMDSCILCLGSMISRLSRKILLLSSSMKGIIIKMC